MKKFIFYCDVHRLSTIELGVYLFEKLPKQYTKVFLGDNFDLKNCKKSDVEKCKILITNAKKECDIWISGNHELNHERKLFHIYKDNIFTHGDYILWGAKKADKYRAKSPGAGFFKRQILARSFQLFRQYFKHYRLKEIQIKRAIDYMKEYNCKTIIMGHTHTKKIYIYQSGIYKIILLPRGKNSIDL